MDRPHPTQRPGSDLEWIHAREIPSPGTAVVLRQPFAGLRQDLAQCRLATPESYAARAKRFLQQLFEK